MKKGTNILIRVSDVEKEDFERAAEIDGASLSEWMRRVLRKATTTQLKTIGEVPKFSVKPKE